MSALGRSTRTLADKRERVAAGLTIRVVDPDDDYLGIDIFASSGRFAGSARIYAGLAELSTFAGQIEGFPASSHDERRYDFGSRDPRIAGGYASLRFRCVDGAGHAIVDVIIEDDERWHDASSARFAVAILAADLDRFVVDVRRVEAARSGEAMLPDAV